MPITPEQRREHHDWLRTVTQIPTAAGRESRVVAWIEEWVRARPGLELVKDAAGNLHVAGTGLNPADQGATPPIYFTAHLDHPAFVVERIIGPGTVQVSFRGGVMDEYFKNARVVIFDHEDDGHPGEVRGEVACEPGPFKHYLVELDEGKKHVGETPAPAERLAVGDVGVWELPAAEEIEGCMHTWACDDLAALAAALAAYDVLYRAQREAGTKGGRRESAEVERQGGGRGQDVRLLFTRAEEIGFIGAIAACRLGTMPRNARVLALENSRSFPESPIGGGPIVRVGDRLSVFSPGLTAAVASRAEEIAGGPAEVRASQKQSERPAWRWQRKLMAGGACEATVFCHAGYESTCLCLPLGNYHNMADLAAVQAGTNATPPKVGREFISLADFDGLVDLLVACGERLPASPPIGERIEKLWAERKFVLD